AYWSKVQYHLAVISLSMGMLPCRGVRLRALHREVPVSSTPQTIYLIDDDPSVRKALRRLLRFAGWTVTTFPSAEAFLQAHDLPAPGCLLVDMHLPGMNGLALKKRLQEEGRNIPFVFITAFGDEELREQALREGAVAFLEKPFEEQALLDAV